MKKNYWKKFYKNFLNYLYKQKFFNNYIGMLIKILRSVFRFIEEDKLIPVGPFFKSFHVPKEEIPIIIQNCNTSGKKKNRPKRNGSILPDELFVLFLNVHNLLN